MPSDSPFYLTKLECPICKTVNEFETVKVGAYIENGRDTDFCPKEILWRFPKYEGWNPLVFFTATCSNCFYTREFNNSFKEWKSDNTFRTYRLKQIKEKHLDQLAQADSAVKQLGQMINVQRYPNESAILKLLLCAFDEQLFETHSKLDLGRYYLRIAWLFRHHDNGDTSSMRELKSVLLDVDAKLRQMRHSIESSRSAGDEFTRHLEAHFDTKEVPVELESRMLPYRDKFIGALKEIEAAFSHVEKKMDIMNDLMGEYKSQVVGLSGNGSASFGQFPSFSDFLIHLKEKWNGIVIDENEAIRAAIHNYKEAFAIGRDISPGNQEIQASYLIAELSRRAGDFDSAREYFNRTIKNGQEFIYQNRTDRSRTALARKILELAVEQGRANLAQSKEYARG